MSLVLIFFLFFLICLFTFYLFDRVVKLEYRDYKKQWIADGKPIGFFWAPRESDNKFLAGIPTLASSNARGRQSVKWVFHTPDWAREDKQVLIMLLQYRIFVVLSSLGVLAWGWLIFS